jgi:type II secretory pathway component PulC
MKKFKFNLSFLDRFKKQNRHSDEEVEETIDEDVERSEFESDETPEEFAEKTLGGLNLNQYREQLDEAKNNVSDSDEDIEDAIKEEFNFKEMELPLPGKPEAVKRFKFKFPKFNSASATDKIKSTLSGKSAMNSIDKFSWNDFVLRLFSPYTRGRIHSAFIILLVITLTYMAGKNMALFFSKTTPLTTKAQRPVELPLEKKDTTLQDLSKITSTNLFNAKESDKAGSVTEKKDIDSIVCIDAEKPTALQIKLLDTIVLQDSVKSVASVQVRGSAELMNVREGERLEGMAEVSKIDRMKLILKNLETGDCEYATTEGESETMMPPMQILSPAKGKKLFKSLNPNIKNTGNNFKIKKAFRDNMMNNMSEILTQAKALQITNPDGSLCFKMTEIVPGSIYSQLDIQENDIICQINGRKIDNLNELMSLLGKLKDIDQFQIGMKRNGMTENKEYGFE